MDRIKKPIVEVGQQVRFDPFDHIRSFGSTDVRGNLVTGVVVYVNKRHKWFSVEYGSPVSKTSFKFCDIGNGVKICG